MSSSFQGFCITECGGGERFPKYILHPQQFSLEAHTVALKPQHSKQRFPPKALLLKARFLQSASASSQGLGSYMALPLWCPWLQIHQVFKFYLWEYSPLPIPTLCFSNKWAKMFSRWATIDELMVAVVFS